MRVDTSQPVNPVAVAARVRAQTGWPVGVGGRLHNVTLYAEPGAEFEAMRRFYAGLPDASVVYEEPGHLCCFEAGPDLAVAVHEAEPGHPAGTRELFFWVERNDDEEVRLTDPQGNLIRLHRRRPS